MGMLAPCSIIGACIFITLLINLLHSQLRMLIPFGYRILWKKGKTYGTIR
jgi:hypothetical protein